MNRIYVAFSIHGTSTYLFASKEVGPEYKVPEEFTVVESRNPIKAGGITYTKYHWSKLMTKKGEPLRCASVILHRFRKLEKEYGFEISPQSYERFKKLHFCK